MIDNLIYVEKLTIPEIDRAEVLRYARVRVSDEETDRILDECIALTDGKVSSLVCYRIFDIKICEDSIDLGFARTSSKSLMKTMSDCDKAIVFCATAGGEIDRLIARNSLTSPAKAIMLQALGSERVEAVCDAFCHKIADTVSQMGYACTKRFSPGYGDLPLELQRDIFLAIAPTVKIGVNLGENLFMTPTKSVTAIIGLKNVK